MASTITHIILTNKIYNNIFKTRNKKKIIIGTCFPDIRNIAGIKRDITHFKNLKIDDLVNDSDFYAGFKFHSILDEKRENYINNSGIYSMYEKTKEIIGALKIVEDRVYYNKIENWNEYIRYFNNILKEEVKIGIPRQIIQNWHEILQQYLLQKPNKEVVDRIFYSNDFTKEMVEKVNKNVVELENDPRVLDIIKDFYENFETIILE